MTDLVVLASTLASTQASIFAGALLMAFAIDHFFGEPPTRLHPVVWRGNCLNWAAAKVLPQPPKNENAVDYPSFLAGAGVWIFAVALFFIAFLGRA